MNYWKVILATVVIFGAGVFTGGLLVNYVDHSHPRTQHRPGTAGAHPQPTNAPSYLGDLPKLRPAEMFNEGFVRQLNGVLQLSSDQLENIRRIIAEGQERNHNIWTNSTAEMRKVMQDTRRQIREQLTPAQQKQFEDLLKQFRAPKRPQNGTNAPPAKVVPMISTNATAI